MKCLDCGGEPDSTKHQMTCVKLRPDNQEITQLRSEVGGWKAAYERCVKDLEDAQKETLKAMEERAVTFLQVGELKKALYAECRALSCGPECEGGGYRSCRGCDNRARAAYGLGWGSVTEKPFSDSEIKARLALIENGKCPECGQKVHLHNCTDKQKCEALVPVDDHIGGSLSCGKPLPCPLHR
jgi:hypothetical protein